MATTVDQARTILRSAARNAGDLTGYPPFKLDIAIYGILSDFIRETRCTEQTDTVPITIDTAAVSFTGITSFVRARVKDIRVVKSADYSYSDIRRSLERPGVDSVNSILACESSSGIPRSIAFTSATAAIVAPPPKATGTLSVVWHPLLVSWTFGQASVTTALNVPDDHIVNVLNMGGSAELQRTDPEHGYGDRSFALYVAYRDSMKGADGDGSNVIVRESRESIRRWGR